MLTDWLISAGALLVLILGWVGVQALARQSAARHPATGPFREAGGGCGGGCCGTPTTEDDAAACAGGQCGPCDTISKCRSQ